MRVDYKTVEYEGKLTKLLVRTSEASKGITYNELRGMDSILFYEYLASLDRHKIEEAEAKKRAAAKLKK